MKKVIYSTLLVCVLLTVTITAYAETTIVDETFEGYSQAINEPSDFTYVPFVAGSSTVTYEVFDDGAPHNNSVRMVANFTGTSFGAAASLYKGFVFSGSNMDVEADMKGSLISGNTAIANFAVRHNAYQAAVSMNFDTSVLQVYNSAGDLTDVPLVTVSANTWYNVKMEIDYLANTYNVYLDDSLIISDVPMLSTPSDTTTTYRFFTSTGSGGGVGGSSEAVGVYDNVLIIDTTPVAVNPRTGETTNYMLAAIIALVVFAAGLLAGKKAFAK